MLFWQKNQGYLTQNLNCTNFVFQIYHQNHHFHFLRPKKALNFLDEIVSLTEESFSLQLQKFEEFFIWITTSSGQKTAGNQQRRKNSLKWAKQRVSSCFQSKVTKARFNALKIKEVTAYQVKHMIKMGGVVFWTNWNKTESIWPNFKFFIDKLHLHTFVCRLQPPEVDFACSPRVEGTFLKSILHSTSFSSWIWVIFVITSSSKGPRKVSKFISQEQHIRILIWSAHCKKWTNERWF